VFVVQFLKISGFSDQWKFAHFRFVYLGPAMGSRTPRPNIW
jgi:hypothetical protein